MWRNIENLNRKNLCTPKFWVYFVLYSFTFRSKCCRCSYTFKSTLCEKIIVKEGLNISYPYRLFCEKIFVRVCRRPRMPREDESRSVRIGLTTVRALKLSRFLIWTKESKSGKSFWEKTDFERSAKHGLLCQIQSRHLNVLFGGNLGNPDSFA